MDVILHVGAHRTGTTSFQACLRESLPALTEAGVGFWGPRRTRGGLLHGLAHRPETRAKGQRARGRVGMNLAMAAKKGVSTLVVSDENMIGTTRNSLRARRLYPDIGERMARIHHAFGPVKTVALQIRALDLWWASAAAYLVARGQPVPSAASIAAIADSPRSWRDVITDLACACPGSQIVVTLFEEFGARPDMLFETLTGRGFPGQRVTSGPRLNRSLSLPGLRACLAERGEDPDLLPDGQGRWPLFAPPQALMLRETYADDLFWLKAGADGMAILKETTMRDRPGLNLATALRERGRYHDGLARRVARTRPTGIARAQP